MPNLYELAEEFASLRHAADDEALTDDELAKILDALDESRIDLRTKVDAICKLIANIDSDAEAIQREERRLAARRKALQGKEERLRDWVRATMDLVGVAQIKTDVHVVSLQPGQPTVVVKNLDLIPEQYVTKVVTPNKKEILAAYRTHGEIVPGADIVEGKMKLVIR